MNNGDFKIGDKVKLKSPEQWSMGNSIGTVVGFDDCHVFYVRVTWEGGYWRDYPHLVREIKHVVKIGEQLEFSFMTP